MTNLDLDAIRARSAERQQFEEGSFLRRVADGHAADDVPALVAEVERQAAIIASFKQMWVELSAAPYGEAAMLSDVAREIRRHLDSEWPAPRTSDSSSTGGQS